MRTFLVVAFVLMIQMCCGVALLLALHILNDPLNTGYLHLGGVAMLPLAGALLGYAFPRE